MAQKKAAPAPAQPQEILTPEENAYLNQVGRAVKPYEFYRDRYRLLLKVSVVEVFIILFLCFCVYLIIDVQQPKDSYYVTTVDGRLVPLIDLADPNLSQTDVMGWTVEAVTDVLSFSSANYKTHFQDNFDRNFTNKGKTAFTDSVAQMQLIEALQRDKGSVVASPAGVPVIVSQGLFRGQYRWMIEMPVTLQYKNPSGAGASQSVGVRLTLVRVTRLEARNGVGIMDWSFYALPAK